MSSCLKTRFAVYSLRNLCINRYRNFSGVTSNIYPENKLSNSTILNPNPNFGKSFNQTRRLSLQGIVDWQQNLYTSISHSSPVEVIQTTLLKIHEVSGMPWWFTIVVSTVAIRGGITLPLTIYQNYILAKVEMAGLELKELVEELKKETAIAKRLYKLSDKEAMMLFKRSLKKQWRLIIERDNCHPFKASLVIWLQMPLWVCTSFALRNLVNMQPAMDAAAMITFTELTLGGFGWIHNLTQPDTTWIVPVAFGLINLSIIELQAMSKIRVPSRFHTIVTNCFRGFTIVMVPIAATVPSCMCLYWLTSSSLGLLQNIVLLSPNLRRKVGIIEAPSELEDPYNHIKNELKHKFSKLSLTKYSSKSDT